MAGQRYDVVIVGGGHGGAQAAIALRQQGFAGSIAIIGEEPDPPYERPALSKEYLAGTKSFERMLLRPAAFWAERAIAIVAGRQIISVDPDAHEVGADDGSRIGYGALIWAAGGRPRNLTCPGHDLRGVHAVRTRADVDRMIAELPDVRRVVVVGGGFIGLEAASALTKQGLAVTVCEAQDRVLARVAGVAISRFFEAEHRRHGVDVRLNALIERLEGDNGRVTAVRLLDGTVIDADMVVVGIGIIPEVEPLRRAGAATFDGVEIDQQCRTSLVDIYAVGDCARHHNRFADGAPIRLESVQNANDMAATVASVLSGKEASYEAVPWFWSNQYDLKLQTVGLSSGHDDAVVRGDPASGSFSVIYLRNGRVQAVDAVNAVRDYVQGRALVEAAAVGDPAMLADINIPLKAMLER